jgi:hypothetical protein
MERSGARRHVDLHFVFTFAEVFEAKCEGLAKPLAEDEDRKIEQLLRQKWIRPVVVDEMIGVAARPRDASPCGNAKSLQMRFMSLQQSPSMLRRCIRMTVPTFSVWTEK